MLIFLQNLIASRGQKSTTKLVEDLEEQIKAQNIVDLRNFPTVKEYYGKVLVLQSGRTTFNETSL